MDIPGWLVPLLLGLGVVCACIPMAAPIPRSGRGWAIAGLVLGAVAVILILASALATKGT